MEPRIVKTYLNIKTRFFRMEMLVVVVVLAFALVATNLRRGRCRPPPAPPVEPRGAGPYL